MPEQALLTDYRDVFRAHACPTLIVDAESLRLLAVNAAAVLQYGYTEAEFLGLSVNEIGADLVSRLDARGATHADPHGETRRARHRRKDGSLLFVDVRSRPIVFDGRPAHVVMAEDVTRRAELELRSEVRYRRLFEDAATGNYVSTLDGRLLTCNAAFARIVGFNTPEDVLRVAASSMYATPADRDLFVRDLEMTGTIRQRPALLRRVDGEVVHALENAILALGEDQQTVEIHGTVIDDSERVALERQLRQSQKMDAIGQLAGGIAHDFNNLLTAIIGNVELLGQELPVVPEFVGEIAKAADSAARLTSQLLAFSRRQLLHPTVLDVNAVIGTFATILQRTIGEDVHLDVRFGTALPTIKADAGQLQQILLNLSVNARDAMPRGGRLIIETSRTSIAARPQEDLPAGEYVVLTVIDTGDGMDEATQARIFEPFFTTKERGTGLGLSTVYGIVKQSGGHISVESAVGHGTTFRLYFAPHLDARASDAPADEGTAVPAAKESQTVLLVEDEEPVRHVAKKLLERLDYRVMTAASAAEALRVSDNYPGHIDVMLTDVVLPGMTGPQCAAALLVKRPTLKVAYMSGYINLRAAERQAMASAPLLMKPFSLRSLASHIHEALAPTPDVLV